MSEYGELESSQAGRYVAIVVGGLILGYLAGIGFPRLVAGDAAYAATHADYYRSAPGGQRAIDLYYLFRNIIICIGVTGSVCGIYIHQLIREHGEIELDTILILKFAALACVGGFIFFAVSLVPSVFLFDIPSIYNPYELDTAHQARVFQSQATVLGVIISLAGLIIIGYRRWVRRCYKNQLQRYNSTKRRYIEVIRRIGEEEELDTKLLEEYHPRARESLKEREQNINKFDQIIDIYELLCDYIDAISERAENIEYNEDISYIYSDLQNARRTIRNGETDGLGKERKNMEKYSNIVSRAELRDTLIDKIERTNFPPNISEGLNSRVFSADISNSGSKKEYKDIEKALDTSIEIIKIGDNWVEIRTESLWEWMNMEIDDNNIDNIETLSESVSNISQVLSFCEQNNQQYTGIKNSMLMNRLNISIEGRDREGIESIVQKIREIDEPWRLDDLYAFDGISFERFIAKLWDGRGYRTSLTPGSGDKGVDVIAENSRERIAIQAKANSQENTVGPKVVRQTAGLLPRGYDRVEVVTSSSFTSQAKEEARLSGDDMTLVDGRSLVQQLNESNLVPESFRQQKRR